MRLTRASAAFHRNGRIRGSYVYMLLCQSSDGIHIKVGLSNDPLQRLQSLLTSCPLQPGVMATVELQSRKTALRFEQELHCVLAKWRNRGREWFLLQPREKAEFNEQVRSAAVHFANPAWPIHWARFSVPALLDAARSRKAMHLRRMKKRGRAFRDFVKDSGARAVS